MILNVSCNTGNTYLKHDVLVKILIWNMTFEWKYLFGTWRFSENTYLKH